MTPHQLHKINQRRKLDMDEKTMYKLSYGLFVLTVRENAKDNGCIINTAIQASLKPNQLSISVSKENYTHDMLKRTGEYNISILNNDVTFEMIKRFGFQSGKASDKFESFKSYARSKNGIYYISEGTNAYISAKVDKEIDLGSHTMFIGEVTDAVTINDIPSVTYEYYQNNIKPRPQKTDTEKTIWRCRICGYEYEGENLPDDFICPWCKHPASDFEKVTAESSL